MAIKQIISPLPGTFYRKPTPDAPPFKGDGDVMKSFHEIQAQFGGKIVKFLIDNEEPIMAGQPIAEVEV
jgi:acetyl-CoA carboxylase biotin carboxyl carrier protein